MINPLPHIIIALSGKVLFLSPSQANDLWKFLSAAGLFIIVYFFMLSLGQKKETALFTPSLLIFWGMNLFLVPIYFNSLGEIFSNFNVFSRPIIPVFNCLLLFAFLLFYWRTISVSESENGNPDIFKNYNLWISGALLGLGFYVFVYTWTFIVIFLGIQMAIFALQKDKRKLLAILMIFLTAVVVALPYLFNLFDAMGNPNYLETSMRYGLVEGRKFVIGSIAPLMLIFCLFLFPKKDKRLYYLFLSLSISAIVVLNQQIITGRMMQLIHYHWNINKPVFLIVFSIVIFYWANKIQSKKYYKLVIMGVIIILAIGGLASQAASYLKWKSRFIELQRYSLMSNWINKELPKEPAVWSNGYAAILLPAYTSANVYNNPFSIYYLVSNEYLKKMLFLKYKLEGVKVSDVENIFLNEKRAEVSGSLYGMYYREKYGDRRKIPDDKLISLAREYKESYSKDTREQFEDIGIEYIVWDKSDSEYFYDKIDFLEKIYEDNDEGQFAIYKVK